MRCDAMTAQRVTDRALDCEDDCEMNADEH
jgi:hypothetical protein